MLIYDAPTGPDAIYIIRFIFNYEITVGEFYGCKILI